MRCNDGKGWVKLYKSVLDHPYLKNPKRLSVWIHLLLSVAYEPTEAYFNNEKIILQPGQGVFTITEISTDLGISRSDTQNTLKLLRSENMIDTEPKRWNTLISIVNWSKYQGNDTEVIQKVHRNYTEVKSLHYIKNKELRNRESDDSDVDEIDDEEVEENLRRLKQITGATFNKEN